VNTDPGRKPTSTPSSARRPKAAAVRTEAHTRTPMPMAVIAMSATPTRSGWPNDANQRIQPGSGRWAR
jgi:hypothetical protein